jgi:hypothetical protein
MTDQSVVGVNLRLLWELRASDSATEIPVRSHQHSVSEAVKADSIARTSKTQIRVSTQAPLDTNLIAREPWNCIERLQVSPPRIGLVLLY